MRGIRKDTSYYLDKENPASPSFKHMLANEAKSLVALILSDSANKERFSRSLF